MNAPKQTKFVCEQGLRPKFTDIVGFGTKMIFSAIFVPNIIRQHSYTKYG